MAQKNKVKELVGRGLGSYHTKSLQQIDRIEKKNKEQNHKINILTNELDNDYLTKTEEGSVISLEHSKEGMIYLDELQGNTLVNYCTDGAKELTLNGDIDVEGTSVTLTEGVDNGKVDVICKGNTLVNLVKGFNEKETVIAKNYELLYSKPNTIYTVLLDIELTSDTYAGFLKRDDKWSGGSSRTTISTSGTHIFKFTPTDEDLRFRINGGSSQVIVNNLIVLEGDYTNKEIPTEHFEGMKSVGECEDNKIEILSNNGSLIDFDITKASKVNCSIVGNSEKFTITTDGSASAFKYIIFPLNYTFKKGVTYTFNAIPKKIEGTPRAYVRLLYKDNTIEISNQDVGSSGKKTFTPTEDITDMRLWFYGSFNNASQNGIFEVSNVIISLDNSLSYRPYALNKKEILLNEPLRALPNGVKDKIIKIGGKHYVERICEEVVLDGSKNEYILGGDYSSDSIITIAYAVRSNAAWSHADRIICDRFIGKTGGDSVWLGKSEGITSDASRILIGISKSKLSSLDDNGVRQWLQQNPTTVIYALETPTYEEITEPTLNTYNDITHISNNSAIPCNMKIQNSGYNAIIKPSTQYTVALDTNKSGTIGINLGGAKVTTTNNVATITTPATLTDDSLRLYGKGINASKVRLLEGDKTNWIPSHFEGMKSSFEDKLQEDGTFKMEILSNNGNLINLEEQVRLNNKSGMSCSLKEYNGTMSWEIYTQSYIEYYNYLRCQYKPNTQYTMYFDCNMTPHDDRATFAIKVMYENSHTETFSMNKDTKNVQFTTLENRTVKRIYFSNWQYSGRVNIYNMKFCEGSDVLVEEKSNKIQFSSIEPLRGIGDVKDRFVFKDGKLMIERNTIKIVLNGSEAWGIYPNQLNRPLRSKCYYIVGFDKFDISDNNSVCDIFSNVRNCYNSADINCFSDYNTAPNKYFTSFCNTLEEFKEYLKNNNATLVGKIKKPTYEEVPYELQKIILEGYENGTLSFDTNIPPTSTATYAGETPIVKSVKLNKTEVLNNSNDINDNIVPYLMDMDYRVVCLQLEGGIENISMARLFGGTYEMLQRDILSNRYSKEEYKHRLDAYLSANKITQDEYTKLGDMLND